MNTIMEWASFTGVCWGVGDASSTNYPPPKISPININIEVIIKSYRGNKHVQVPHSFC